MGKAVATFMALLLVGCATASDPPAPASLSGCYESYDWRVYTTLQLRLVADGTYAADLLGELGSWGTGSGAWTLQDNTVTLHPDKENNAMVGLMETLMVERSRGTYKLTPDLGWGELSSVQCEASFASGDGL